MAWLNFLVNPNGQPYTCNTSITLHGQDLQVVSLRFLAQAKFVCASDLRQALAGGGPNMLSALLYQPHILWVGRPCRHLQETLTTQPRVRTALA